MTRQSVRLIGSRLALSAALALVAAPGRTLAEVVAALQVSTSSAKRALEVLLADGYATRDGRVYRLAPGELTERMVAFAERLLPAREVVGVLARASGQVEFVGEDERLLKVVFARDSDPLAESVLAGRLARQAERMGRRADCSGHNEVRRRLLAEPASRRAFLRLRPIVGDPTATFPDRSRHGLSPGRPLGRPHHGLRLPSGRALSRLRTRYGIQSARLFGSSVRTDFGPGSDVDVAVGLEEELPLSRLLDLERDLERLFDRDVDLVLEPLARPRVRAAIDREGVSLLR